MTATLMTPTTSASASRRGGKAARFVRYFGHSLAQTLRDWAFLVFVIAMPTTLYIFFSSIFGSESDGSATVAATMMVSMAAYGGLGAAMSAGNALQIERSNGWFRQLMVTPLSPTSFLAAKLLVAVVVIIPALAAVFVAGALRGVQLSAQTWASTFVILLICLTPMILLGLSLGMFFSAQASQAATTIVLLVLSIAGGLMVPLEFMPDAFQRVGQVLPSYWIGELGLWPIQGGVFPVTGVWVLLAWTILLSVTCAIGYRRATRNAPR